MRRRKKIVNNVDLSLGKYGEDSFVATKSAIATCACKSLKIVAIS